MVPSLPALYILDSRMKSFCDAKTLDAVLPIDGSYLHSDVTSWLTSIA
jgi:hypothetical protein